MPTVTLENNENFIVLSFFYVIGNNNTAKVQNYEV